MTIYTHPAMARHLFRELAAGEIDNSNLARGALLIALEDYRQLGVDEYLGKLDRLADEINASSTDSDRFEKLLDRLFRVEQFAGNEQQYYDPKNSYLNEVIDLKRGIPITLSIIFLHVAHRLGFEAAGVGLPGHYVVKVRFGMSEVYIDPFYGGAEMTVADLAELVQRHSSGRATLESSHLRGWSGRETLVRVLTNLQNVHARSGDLKRSAAARERIELLLRPAEN